MGLIVLSAGILSTPYEIFTKSFRNGFFFVFQPKGAVGG
jgi:hypothetical protein